MSVLHVSMTQFFVYLKRAIMYEPEHQLELTNTENLKQRDFYTGKRKEINVYGSFKLS